MSSNWLSFEAQRSEEQPFAAIGKSEAERQDILKHLSEGDFSVTVTAAYSSGPEAGSEDSQKFFATHARWTASDPTGAFDNPLTSFRLMPIPSRWPEIIGTVGGLYGFFIGIPALAGAWALWRILHGGM